MKRFILLSAFVVFALLITIIVQLCDRIHIPLFNLVNSVEYGSKPIVLLLGGDVMLGRSVTVQSLDINHKANFPFEMIQAAIDQSDILFVNLETPIMDNCPRRTDGMIFCAPSEMLSGFPSGKTVVNLANNHTANYGTGGVKTTQDILTQKGITYTGYTQLATKKVAHVTFGFLGFDKSQQANPVLSDAEKTLIRESNQRVDVLVVALHWGIEYQSHPTEGQKKLAHELVSLGADVIVGHHPHWVQDVESIEGVPVYYSLGNLIFDQTWSEETRHGLLVKVTFNGKGIEKQELISTYIQAIGQPIIMPSPKE